MTKPQYKLTKRRKPTVWNLYVAKIMPLLYAREKLKPKEERRRPFALMRDIADNYYLLKRSRECFAGFDRSD